MVKRSRVVSTLAAAVCSLLISGGALAVDGVIEINQTKALAGLVTPTDAPLFPVTIDSQGSYRLTSDLIVDSGKVIEILTDHVSLDLNGFSIACRPPIGAAGCPDAGGLLASGIDANGRSNISIANGSVRSIGGFGIQAGHHCRLQNLRVLGNLFGGLELGSFCVLEGVDASENGGNAGISAASATTVRGCTAANNAGAGFVVSNGSTVNESTASGNAGVGFSTSWGTTFRGCAAYQNAIGIMIFLSGTVTGCSADSNVQEGIFVGVGSTVTHSSTRQNGASGILAASGSTLIGNTAHDNTSFGFSVDDDVGYAHNVLVGNNGGTGNPQTNGGTELGTNFCDTDTICP
jgi:hypothetical protein